MTQPLIVLADDLTGAAEIAGIALQKGYDVSVCTNVPKVLQTAVTVIATNTRSLSAQEANRRIATIAQALKPFYPFHFFKKIDSVLRGHIEDEVEAWLRFFPYSQTVILPANPSLGRIMSEGIYWVQGQPIHHTSFALDPEFPWHKAQVLSRFKQAKFSLLSPTQALPTEGFFILEVATKEDIEHWTKAFSSQTLVVGAAAVFETLLAKLALASNQVLLPDVPIHAGKKLYVSGTSFRKSVEAIAQMAQHKHAVSYMPVRDLTNNQDKIVILQNWVADITQYLAHTSPVVMAIHPDTHGTAQDLAFLMAQAVKEILNQHDITEILIEGGATAAAIIEAMQWQYFKPIASFAQGVIRMQCENTPTYLTLKPGSYDWPTAVWEFPRHKV